MGRRRTVAIIQARMKSSRLPGKVLKDIVGKPMLAWVADRASRAKSVEFVGVATTMDSTDDPIVAMCRERKYPVYRGSSFDVLDRFYQAAILFKADVIVRLTADCPLIDPDLIDLTVDEFFRNGVDFAANRLPPPWKRTFPIGLDTEVCSFEALEFAWREADSPHQREHVMPYLYEEKRRFRTFLVNHEPDYGHLRWTVDTPDDLNMIRELFAQIKNRENFSWKEILELFEKHPELAEINASVQHKTVHDIDERIK